MKIVLILFTLLTIHNVWADQSRASYSFKSANGYFELRPSDTIFSDKKIYTDTIHNEQNNSYSTYSYTISDGYYWSMYDLRTNTKLYTIKDDKLIIQCKTACISDDGERVVIIDDFSGGIGYPEEEVAHFFKRGGLVHTLTLSDLLDNMCSVHHSTSHVQWCSTFGFKDDSTFQLKTNEFYYFLFDSNGKLIEKRSDERIKPTDDIVVAKIKRLEKDRYSFLIKTSIRNRIEPETELIITISDKTMRKIHGKFFQFLHLKNKLMENGFTQTLLFRDHKPIYSEIIFPSYTAYPFCSNWNDEIEFQKNIRKE